MFAVELSCSGCGAGDRDASCARAWWLTEPDAAERRHFVTRWEAHVAGQQEVLTGSTHAHAWHYAVVELPASSVVGSVGGSSASRSGSFSSPSQLRSA